MGDEEARQALGDDADLRAEDYPPLPPDATVETLWKSLNDLHAAALEAIAAEKAQTEKARRAHRKCAEQRNAAQAGERAAREVLRNVAVEAYRRGHLDASNHNGYFGEATVDSIIAAAALSPTPPDTAEQPYLRPNGHDHGESIICGDWCPAWTAEQEPAPDGFAPGSLNPDDGTHRMCGWHHSSHGRSQYGRDCPLGSGPGERGEPL